MCFNIPLGLPMLFHAFAFISYTLSCFHYGKLFYKGYNCCEFDDEPINCPIICKKMLCPLVCTVPGEPQSLMPQLCVCDRSNISHVLGDNTKAVFIKCFFTRDWYRGKFVFLECLKENHKLHFLCYMLNSTIMYSYSSLRTLNKTTSSVTAV